MMSVSEQLFYLKAKLKWCLRKDYYEYAREIEEKIKRLEGSL